MAIRGGRAGLDELSAVRCLSHGRRGVSNEEHKRLAQAARDFESRPPRAAARAAGDARSERLVCKGHSTTRFIHGSKHGLAGGEGL